jgi:predicted phage terminase large subunit-like protein
VYQYIAGGSRESRQHILWNSLPLGVWPRIQEIPVSTIPADVLRDVLDITDRLDELQARKKSRASFLDFVDEVWPAFIMGNHHRIMSNAFERIVNGDLKRLIINMPPRHTKSEFASYILPSWFLGRYPDKKIIQTAHTAELSVGFGRKVRNLVGSDDFKKVFPGVSLRSDSKAAGRWNTNHGGEYFAIGVGGAVTGKGADLFIIDDPHSEQDAQMGDATVFDRVYEWYTSGPRQRLQPGGAICLVMTRWSQRDLTGRLIQDMAERPGSDDWEVIEFPAILPDTGHSLWPEFWSTEELNKIKAALPASKWSAQYQQDPTADESAIIKRSWWRTWDQTDPPPCDFIIQSWDTAFLKTQRADYSACTTWGVFQNESGAAGDIETNIILLNAFQKRMEFPELKSRAFEEYQLWQPDACIVESKAAGTPLIFELRAMGIPVSEYSPSRGNDKVARVNAVADMFSSGIVWVPRRRFAEEVIEQFAGFPGAAAHDDLVDSSTQALIRFRQGGFLPLKSDEDDEFVPRQETNYY